MRGIVEKEIKIIIIDDHELIRSAIRNSLEGDSELKIVGEGCNGQDLRRLVKSQNPDVLITDLQMPDSKDTNEQFQPISELNKIQIQYPDLKIIIISQEVDVLIIKTLAEIGIKGYLSKSDQFGGALVNIIKMCVQTNGGYFSKEVKEKLIKNRIEKSVNLTDRELEVIRAVGQYPYISRKALAKKFVVSESTLKKHVNNIFKSLDVPNMESCLIKAIRMNLISQNDLWDGNNRT